MRPYIVPVLLSSLLSYRTFHFRPRDFKNTYLGLQNYKRADSIELFLVFCLKENNGRWKGYQLTCKTRTQIPSAQLFCIIQRAFEIICSGEVFSASRCMFEV